jgi:hypothetical protein
MTAETRMREWNIKKKKKKKQDKTSHSFIQGYIFGPICWTWRMKS